MKFIKYLASTILGIIMGFLASWITEKQEEAQTRGEVAEVFRELSMSCVVQKNEQLYFRKKLPSNILGYKQGFVFYSPSFIENEKIEFSERDRLVVAFLSLNKRVIILTEALQVYEVNANTLKMGPQNIWWNGEL